RFVTEIIKQGGVSCKFLDSGLAVEFGIERSLQHSDSQWTFSNDLFCPRHVGVFQHLQWNHLVDESHLQCFTGVVLITEIPDFARLFLSFDPRHVGGAKAAVKTSDLGPGLAEACIFSGDGQVAYDVENMSAAD